MEEDPEECWCYGDSLVMAKLSCVEIEIVKLSAFILTA